MPLTQGAILAKWPAVPYPTSVAQPPTVTAGAPSGAGMGGACIQLKSNRPGSSGERRTRRRHEHALHRNEH